MTQDKEALKAGELLPCPFCGKPPKVCPDTSYGAATVFCPDENGCPVQPVADAELNAGETVADAISRWNIRAALSPTPDAGEVQAVSGREAFIWRWIERAIYDKQISASEALSVLAHSPHAPWSNGRWDVDHKPYAAKLYADHPKAAAIRKLGE
jgi:hypothetical protein